MIRRADAAAGPGQGLSGDGQRPSFLKRGTPDTRTASRRHAGSSGGQRLTLLKELASFLTSACWGRSALDRIGQNWVASIGYRLPVPPCFDVYVWVESEDKSHVLSRFIDRYVDTEQPGDARFDAFVRTFVWQRSDPGDVDTLVELNRGNSPGGAFSIYLRATAHAGAIVTLTEEGALVLGLSLDDPDNSPETRRRAASLMASLRAEFGAAVAVGGVELAPAQSRSEWMDDAMVLLRDGTH